MKGATYTAAVIGTGRIGFALGFDRRREQPASHTAALNGNRRIRMVAGCDCDASRLSGWGRANKGCRLYGSVGDFLSGEARAAGRVPDIISVAVNEAAHHQVALDVIRARPGLVILEKPVALDSAQAERIKAAAQECGVPVLVNHERRFARDYALARHLAGEIGELQSVSASLHSNLKVWSREAESSGSYSLLHDGTHLVDAVLFLLSGAGGGTAVDLKNPVASGFFFDAENALRNLSVSFSCGICPSVSFSFSGRSGFFGFELDILGTEGRIRIGNGFMEFHRSADSRLYSGFRSLEARRGTFAVSSGGKAERVRLARGRVAGKTGYFSRMVGNAVDFLDGKAPLGSTIDDGMAVLEVLERMRGLVREKSPALPPESRGLPAGSVVPERAGL